MKAVARLVYSYFMGSPVFRAFTISGLILLTVDFYFVATQPQSGEKLWIAVLGIILLFLGTSLMPMMFGRLARSHSIGVLPGGRVKLLASAFITTVLVALPVGILWPASLISTTSSLPEVMKDPRAREYIIQVAAITFTSALLFAGWLYLAMWFMSRQRDIAGFSKGLLVIVIVMFMPAREIQELTASVSWNLMQIAVIWLVFGTGFLLWPRYKAARARRNPARVWGFARAFDRGTAGREIDLMLGTANPWMLIAAFLVPLIIATRFVHSFTQVWLFFLTIFSTVAGAIAGEAAGRSRALWLRGNWTREALFKQVEHSFWRHNGLVLGSLIILLVGIGTYAGFPVVLFAVGLPLLVLGTVLSTYLGLMVTRGLRWPEMLLGVVVMLGLMAVAVVAGERGDLYTVLALEACLAVLAIVLRFVARRRWTQIDWMICRPERVLVERSA